MLKKKVEDAIKRQIQEELYSSYLYLSMASYLDSVNLTGFAHWFKKQAGEENEHAVKFYNFIYERGGKVKLMKIDEPKVEGNCPLTIFEQVLRHEELVTSKINALSDVAEDVKDRAALSFLDWYVKEQVEEEANAQDIISKLKLIGDDKSALYLLDKDLSTRVFVQPMIKGGAGA